MGLLLLVIQTVVDERRATIIHMFTTADGLCNFATILIFAVWPPSMPMTLVGGWLAANLLERSAPRSLKSWLAKGVGWGSVLGASGAALWFGALGWGAPDVLKVLLLMASLGGFAGCIVGSAVATYCWRASRPR
ncbi:MAG: hypothetical protein EPO68_17465 [Planctomycetota bacterium]|nr:MAG: hypothetical protein EPO68_17465 [Planctomycetota bacterium]